MAGGNRKLHLKTAFYAGDYKGVVAQSVDSPGGKWELGDFGVLLGALSFLGRVDEARVLYELHQARLSEARRVECRFFLGIGLARRSDYGGARRLFGENLKSLGRKPSGESRFYIYQGLAFYRYFCGRWHAATRAAEQSFRSAVAAKFLYGRVLSADLRGHVLVQTGEVGAGLRHLSEAEDLARKLRNTGVAESIRISILNYEAEFGLSPRESVRELETAIEGTSVQDTYSRASLLLELARQHMLRGETGRAAAVLDQASRIVYMNQNRRQEVTLNLRYSYLSFLAGDYSRGLNHVRSARRALDPAVDHALELAVLGSELALVRRLGVPEREREIRVRIVAKSERYGGAVNRQIVARTGVSANDGETPEGGNTPARRASVVAAGDRLGLLKSQIAAEPKGASQLVLKTGLLSLLYDVLPAVTAASQVIYLDLEPGTVTLFDHGAVHHSKGLTALHRSLLERLAAGKGSKEQLIQSIWGYSYHPLRHDSLIYTTLAGLRKLLGSRAQWVETTETGYRLASGVRLTHEARQRLNTAASVTAPSAAGPSAQAPVSQAPGEEARNALLNHRQRLYLQDAKATQYISVPVYGKRFKVSPITALRDLTGMHRLGLVVRVGRARATRYAGSRVESI